MKMLLVRGIFMTPTTEDRFISLQEDMMREFNDLTILRNKEILCAMLEDAHERRRRLINGMRERQSRIGNMRSRIVVE